MRAAPQIWALALALKLKLGLKPKSESNPHPQTDEIFENKRSFRMILSAKYVRNSAIQLPRALARG
jgi:hypothetical protein